MRTAKCRRSLRFLLIVLLVSVFSVASIQWYHVRHFIASPIDHLMSNIFKPFYKLQVGLTVQDGRKFNCLVNAKMMITFRQKRESIFFFDHPAQCPLVEEDMSCALPKIFMISARSVQQRKKAFNSWASHDVIVYDTTGKFYQNLSLLLFSFHELTTNL